MDVIYTKDGEPHVVASAIDALDIVEEIAGREIADYITNEIIELSGQVVELGGQVKEAELESSGWYELGNSVRGALDELLNDMVMKRMTQRTIYDRLTDILKMFDGGY